jgi:hypothetical protein
MSNDNQNPNSPHATKEAELAQPTDDSEIRITVKKVAPNLLGEAEHQMHIENFEVILGPGGASVGGWTIHQPGKQRALQPSEILALQKVIDVEFRRNGELLAHGVLDPHSWWWNRMNEELVIYSGKLLPVSVARVRAQALAQTISTSTNVTLENINECSGVQSAKPLAQLQPPHPAKHQSLLSPSEQAFVDRVFGSVKTAFEKDRVARLHARAWLMGRTDITQHRRARPFEEIGRLPGPYTTAKPLEKVLQEYKYPWLKERLITPAAYRHLKKLLKAKEQEQNKLRQRRFRAAHPPVALPIEKI